MVIVSDRARQMLAGHVRFPAQKSPGGEPNAGCGA